MLLYNHESCHVSNRANYRLQQLATQVLSESLCDWLQVAIAIVWESGDGSM